jgi:hypothetical protein
MTKGTEVCMFELLSRVSVSVVVLVTAVEVSTVMLCPLIWMVDGVSEVTEYVPQS